VSRKYGRGWGKPLAASHEQLAISPAISHSLASRAEASYDCLGELTSSLNRVPHSFVSSCSR
jgi:hypothetical protein